MAARPDHHSAALRFHGLALDIDKVKACMTIRMASLAVAAMAAWVSGALPTWAEDGPAVFAATHARAFGGSARTDAVPDLATIQVGVHAEAPTASAALAQQRGEMNAVFASLRTQGLTYSDIQTSELSLSPHYVDEAKSPRRLGSYQASNGVTVRVREIGRVGGVVDALVAAGANEIDGIGFGLSDPGAAEDAARRAALKALQAKADLYAAATGYRIRRLVRLSESGGFQPQPMGIMAIRRLATPVAEGALTVQVSVTAEYELMR